MNKLEKICLAIQEHEGYFPPCDTYPMGSRSYRNNNPGNLRRSKFQAGTRAGFSYFNSYEEGFKALMWDIEQKCKGNTSTGLGPEKTLLDLFKVYAPAEDQNDPTSYANTVAKKLGVPVSLKLKELLKVEDA